MIESQIAARVLPSKCREAVKVLLQEVYGYEDFRNLEVYDDLFKGCLLYTSPSPRDRG